MKAEYDKGRAVIPVGFRRVEAGETVSPLDLVLDVNNAEWTETRYTVGLVCKEDWDATIITPTVLPQKEKGWRYSEAGDIVTSEIDTLPQGFRKLLGEELIQNGDFIAAPTNPYLWGLVKYADGRNQRAGRFDGRVIRAIQVPKREAKHEQWAVWS